jgi:glycosyltransferase involved in cell wall biosynthesis
MQMAFALASEGLDVTVFSLTPVGAEHGHHHALAAAGVRLLAGRPSSNARHGAGAIDTSLENLINPQRPLVEFRRRYRRSAAVAPPDVVHVHGFRLDAIAAAALAARDGIPVVFTEHATLGEGDNQFPAIPDWAWNYLGAVDVVTCVSRQTREVVSAIVPPDVPVLPVQHVIPGPEALVIERRRSAGDALAVLCLSRLTAEKGVEVLVDAAQILARRPVLFRMTLAGGGRQEPHIVDRVDALGLANVVQVLGGYEPPDLPALLRSADVVVSTSHTEGLPLAILEAFAYGVPVVATDVGGVSELVTDEVNGLLVPPGDPQATADALARLADDESLRLRLAEQARLTFETGGYSPPQVAARWLELYSLARSRAAQRVVPPAGSISVRASRLTASTPFSELYRASYSRVAPSMRRWRNARSR